MKKISVVLGILATLWAVGEFTGARPVLKSEFAQAQEDIEANTKYRYIQRFQYLTEKMNHGGLTPEERVELCTLAEILRFRVEGCI